jgi:ATP-dependent Lhr-like helicase
MGRLSPIGRAGLEHSRQIVAPQTPDRATLMALKRRLESENAILLCLNCRTTRTETVARIREPVQCPYCESLMQAALRPYEKGVVALLLKKKLDEEEQKEVKKLYTNASLVRAHGRKAVTALMARGVGPETAARILRRYHADEEEFLRDVLAAEVNYARTKKFWD